MTQDAAGRCCLVTKRGCHVVYGKSDTTLAQFAASDPPTSAEGI
jgi:hypothetical protein